MNTLKLIQAIGDIPDYLISEYTPRRKTPWYAVAGWISAAACVALIWCMVVFPEGSQGFPPQYQQLSFEELCAMLPENHLLAQLEQDHFYSCSFDYEKHRSLPYKADMEIDIHAGIGSDGHLMLYYRENYKGILQDYVEDIVYDPHDGMLMAAEKQTLNDHEVYTITRVDIADLETQFWRIIFMQDGDLYTLEYIDTSLEPIFAYLDAWLGKIDK